VGLRINNNLASLNASLNLGRANKMLSSSLARLSTGLKINNASDGPADLIISEKFRSQINGISKGIENTQNAISMLSTAEGALNEVNSLLTKMKGLALKAAQSGTQDPDEIAASQAEIDAAITSINTISRNTAFGSKNLLDGSLSIETTGVDTNNILVDLDTANFAGDSKDVTVEVVTAATRASTTIDLSGQAVSGTLDSKQVLKITGNRGSTTITFAAGSSAQDIRTEINSQVGQTGIVATLDVNTTAASSITLESAQYGASEFVTVEDVDGDNDLLTTIPSNNQVYSFNGSGVDIISTETYKDYRLDLTVSTAIAAAGVSAHVDDSQKVIHIVASTTTTNATIVSEINSAASTTDFSAMVSTNIITTSSNTSISVSESESPLQINLKENASITDFDLNIVSDTTASVGWDGSALTLTLLGDTAGVLTTNTIASLQLLINANASAGATINNIFNFSITNTAADLVGLTVGTTQSHTAQTVATISNLTSFVKENGTDGALEVNGVKTSANNLTYTFDSGNIRGSITIDEDFNTVSSTETFTISGKGAFLQLGQKAQLSHQVGVAIKSVAANQLATGLYINRSLDQESSTVNEDDTLYTTATLADIISGGDFDLATDAETAFDIIDKAILEVSVSRSKLGAMISNTLESNINSLGVAFENLTAAESRIRDVDFAAETAEFTKAQILVQAGTSIAAQANVATQAALQLLG